MRTTKSLSTCKSTKMNLPPFLIFLSRSHTSTWNAQRHFISSVYTNSFQKSFLRKVKKRQSNICVLKKQLFHTN